MSNKFDSMIQIPVVRADLYPHREDGPGISSDVERLDVDHLGVDADVKHSGRVTLAASGPNSGSDPYDIEVDLDLSSARLLAHQLLAAAERCGTEA
jgi:hypothetical protein